MYGTSRRFTTKPGVSLQLTGVLPQASPNARAAAKTSSFVSSVRTTSTKRINCTGLKKCRPMKRSLRPEASAISPTGKLEVFDAKIVSGLQMPPSSENSDFLTSKFSTMASTTRSQFARSPLSSDGVMRPRTSVCHAAAWSAVILPFSTFLDASLARLFSTRAMPLSKASCCVSSATTLQPPCAATCTMPWPISPQPTTPTF